MGACVVEEYAYQLKSFSVRRKMMNNVDFDIGDTNAVSGEAFHGIHICT